MFATVSSGFSSRRGALVFLLLALLVAVLAPSATAEQPSSAPPQPQLSAGKRLEAIRAEMEKGQGLYVTGNYAGAAAIFEAGYATYPYSAFLFNAGVCYQKLNDVDRALAKFKDYARVDPNAPDIDKVNQRIATLEAAKAAALAAAAAPVVTDAGAADAGPPAPKPPVVLPSSDDQNAMKSLVVIETEPDGAPLRIYGRTDPNAQPFQVGATNPGWKEVVATRAPASLTLDVGHYHVVVEKFRDFNASEADMDVSPGHVHQLKANLSQGQFMAFLRVSANASGAHVWVDDQKKERPEWGETPHGELIAGGAHVVLVELSGFEPLLANVNLQHGEQKELEVRLVRVGYGILRVDASAPSISVHVDDQPKGIWRSGEEPLDVRVDSGPHKVRVSSDGRKTFEGMIDVPRGQVLPLHLTMIPKYPREAAWTQAVVGAALLGGAIYAGVESNRLYDQLQQDRQNGTLEGQDNRATRGQIFAIGADAGFIAAGAFAALATYNFIRDPLPESSVALGKLLEFDDPLKARPVALSAPAVAPSERQAQAKSPLLRFSPQASATGAGLFVGGQF
ncbi:MAG TPA: PEGA domain-containing protein [Polyangiaceae bacterium]|jgi:hypothetical protein|nr:PEGA domain-containing protein [Polyangiaceae bacterium]